MNYHYRINEIKLRIEDSREAIPYKIEKKLGLKPGTIVKWEIRRESIDARDRLNIRLVYTADFWCDRAVNSKLVASVDEDAEAPAEPIHGTEMLQGRPIVIGAGPCGLFAALELAKYGYKPLLLERGSEMSDRVADVDAFRARRILNPESNMLFGEGGAGTFSDGKLTSGIKDGHIRQVLRTFVDAGAGDDIMYLHRPHIGTDVLRTVIVNIRNKIIELGGEVRFNTKMEALRLEDGKLVGLDITGPEGSSTLACNALVLAIGHSARDSFAMINGLGFDMEQKAFSIGVRMEHPQVIIDRAQYGAEDRLPPADYKVSYKASNGRGVYSFCMCPGGEVVVCTTAEGELCVNGMSNRRRDSGTANSGILCDVRTSDFGSEDVLAGVRFQEKWERLAFMNGGADFTAPSCSMKDFLSGAEAAGPVIGSMPDWASEAIREAVPHFARKIRGYDMDEAVVTAVETRSSSPVRILRGVDGQSNIKGVYPAGEGAGYAGGITSAACDGIKAAHKIIERFAND